MIYPPETRLGHHRRYSPERAWPPLSNDEWAVLSPFVFRAAEAEAEAALAVDAAAAGAAAGVPHEGGPRPERFGKPDPDLSEWLFGRVQEELSRGLRAVPPGFLRAAWRLMGAAGGRRCIPRALAPP